MDECGKQNGRIIRSRTDGLISCVVSIALMPIVVAGIELGIIQVELQKAFEDEHK